MPTIDRRESAQWVEETLAKLRLHEAQTATSEKNESYWQSLGEVLADFYSQSFEQFPNHLEEQVSQLYEQSHLPNLGNQLQGFFFENLSRYFPLGHDLVVTYPSGNKAQKNTLRHLEQRTVFELKAARPAGEKLAWDKGALIAHEIGVQLLDELKAQKLEKEVFVYVPALDKNNMERNARLEQGYVLIRFDSHIGEWIAQARDNEKAEIYRHWADKANKINAFLTSSWTLPDAVVLENEKVVGVVETKCWQELEVKELIKHLETNSHAGLLKVKPDIVQVLNTETDSYGHGTEGFDLGLRFAEVIAFVQKSNNQAINRPIIFLRLPQDISRNMMGELSDALAGLSYNVVVQQLPLTSLQTELIASEYIHSMEFVAQLEKRYGQMKNDQVGHSEKNLKRNLKARALGLKLSSETIRSLTLPDTPSEEDHAKNRLKADWGKHFK